MKLNSKLLFTLLILLYCSTINLWSQVSLELEFISRSYNHGNAIDIIESDDGTIFVTYDDGGLRAYELNKDSIINTANIDDFGDAGNAMGIAISDNGIIFVAVDDGGKDDGGRFDNGGLRAYTYDGTSLKNTAYIDDSGGRSFSVAINNNGVVFLANGYDGLRAFEYNSNSFTNIAHIISEDFAYCLEISDSGDIYLGTDNGIRVYDFLDSMFIEQTKTSLFGHSVNDIELGEDSTLFVAAGSGSIVAYKFNGESLKNIGYIVDGPPAYSLALNEEGTIFVGSKYYKILTYTFNGTSFELLNSFNTKSSRDVINLEIGASGRVYSTFASNGFSIYNYNNAIVSEITHFDDCFDEIMEIAVDSKNNIFVANGEDGLVVYENNINKEQLRFITKYSDGSHTNDVDIINDSLLFITNGTYWDVIGNLSVVKFKDNELIEIASANDLDKWDYYRKADISSDGSIFVTSNLNGLMAYKFDGSKLIQIANIFIGGVTTNVVAGENGMVYVDNVDKGLMVYNYDGNNLTLIDKVSIEGGINSIKVDEKDNIYIPIGYRGLKVFKLIDNELTNIGDFNKPSIDVVIDNDGNIITGWLDLYYLSFADGMFNELFLKKGFDFGRIYQNSKNLYLIDSYEDLFIYELNKLTSIDVEFPNNNYLYALKQNYPNPFNPNTVITYSLSKYSAVTLKVYDVLGREIKTLVHKNQAAGKYEVEFDASTSSATGSNLSSGIYYYRLETQNYSKTKKMVLIK